MPVIDNLHANAFLSLVWLPAPPNIYWNFIASQSAATRTYFAWFATVSALLQRLLDSAETAPVKIPASKNVIKERVKLIEIGRALTGDKKGPAR
jgi:hypothetical protein